MQQFGEKQDSIDPVWIPGWAAYSTWGWDSGTRCWYAQMYRDTSDPDAAPDHHLHESEATQLVVKIGAVTGLPSEQVQQILSAKPGTPEYERFARTASSHT
ncbi:hypothetical protein [Kineosporia babensis]|uniref:Uncharacterized protein n=1 Tax=Kineosporia babensis TaxID=499548 RepID=A0A9X1NPI0_9ACTN|nr:hypothetical protein [Kineosporia babensis]MCD5317254.1 hypothetical protein [Kineosporia babensis]